MHLFSFLTFNKAHFPWTSPVRADNWLESGGFDQQVFVLTSIKLSSEMFNFMIYDPTYVVIDSKKNYLYDSTYNNEILGCCWMSGNY